MFFTSFLAVLCLSAPVTPMSDLELMTRALLSAERGKTHAHPNPMVGCVIAKQGRVVAEGWHESYGGDHAEIVALKKAGARAKGADVFVTLEPCAHWGKTPPCADALVKAGVRRVVAAVRDPHAKVAGQGFARLRRAGIRVQTGLLEKESRFLNRAFFKAHTTGLPYVVWKTAQTLDGKIASRTGASRWISNPQARRFAHQLRAESDAVLVGGNTVRRDNPLLTAHGAGPNPTRLILSRTLDLPVKGRIFGPEAPTFVLTVRNPPKARAEALKKQGAQILTCFVKKDFSVLRDCFKLLKKFGLNQILLEGGGDVSASLLAAGLLDEVYHVIAPKYLGGRQATTPLEGEGWPTPDKGPHLSLAESYGLGDNVVIHGFFGGPAAKAWGL
jgi:diaminohydroxyphosphoribosylaminopyrimidine deaminase/5-amino-6-(5-phosphoribosylamino)uracil reductase